MWNMNYFCSFYLKSNAKCITITIIVSVLDLSTFFCDLKLSINSCKSMTWIFYIQLISVLWLNKILIIIIIIINSKLKDKTTRDSIKLILWLPFDHYLNLNKISKRLTNHSNKRTELINKRMDIKALMDEKRFRSFR
jgi:hypothetical protein